MIDISTLRESNDFSIKDIDRYKIALVHHGFRTTQLEYLDKKRPRFSPRFASLGLLNLARSITIDFENGNIPFLPEIKYFDEDCYDDDNDLALSIMDWLSSSKARFILVGLYTLAVKRTAELLAKIDVTKHCIIVGGAHPTVAPNIDYAHLVVRGEGGLALRHIFTKLFESDFGAGPEARGICYRLDEKLHQSGPAFDKSLATIPSPAFAYELSQSNTNFKDRPKERWWKAVGKSPQIYICTQSCRARCTFCSTYLIHGNLVSRPIEFIEQDIDYIIDEFGHDSIHFQDDDLLQHEQFDQLMCVLEKKPIYWTCNARSEFMTIECAEKMHKGGCRKVFLGVESMNQKSLDYYKKRTTVEMNRMAVLNLETVGIGVVCGFIFGAPHDSLESSLADLDRILELPIFFLSASILTPDIGSVEYRRAKKKIPNLHMLGDDGSKFNLQPRPDIFGTAPPYGLPTVCDLLSKEDLNEIYELANCEFFLRETTFERIKMMTPLERMDQVYAWYDWIHERADKLFNSARIDKIRDRIGTLLSKLEMEHFTNKL